MDTKDVIRKLRTEKGWAQDTLAGKVHVTRQAVSRWETGETIPGADTLKLLSRLFGVSVNTLLGEPRRLICQCCGMPLDDGLMSREADGTLNEAYCKWCYDGGKFAYSDMEELIGFLSGHMAGDGSTPAQVREYLESLLPQLDHWKK